MLSLHSHIVIFLSRMFASAARFLRIDILSILFLLFRCDTTL